MLSDYLISPALNALFVTGILLMIIITLFLTNIRLYLKETYFQKIMMLCLLSSSIGKHGMLHLGAEKQYNFNPYKWV